MSDDLDSLVKGAPMPGTPSASSITSASSSVPPPPSTSSPSKNADPLHNAPSSPSMIYLNLLILEASLRAQYLELRARRRHHSFFLFLLGAWTCGFGYALFFAPREDGKGQGGSVYWAVEVAEKLCFMGGVITCALVWGTGIWDRGVRWPRKWFAVSNRGLRGFNCKLVLIKRPWWSEFLSTVGWFLTYGLFSTSATSSYRHVDTTTLREAERDLNFAQGHQQLPIVHGDEEKGGRGHEEDLAPGGDYVKLLLLPKPFSPTFRENWEIYRTEYWEQENERRALLREKLQERDKRLARERWGWSWWLPWRKPATLTPGSGQHGGDHAAHKVHHTRLHSVVEREHKRVRSGSIRRGSVSSSRSPTPSAEVMDPLTESSVSRRASTASNASERRKKKSVLGSGKGSLRKGDSRSITPDFPSPLARESIVASEGSMTATELQQGMGTRALRSQASGSSMRSL
ncbi:Spo7-like protein-domain-containing protein [Zalerion maritima]|uniref:Spo7-like protein-domain-containing protein n=1 Tax=Zalerion maritima TaxID=339359 RepID=A0AAD5WRP8_9PEZI|nr:Spo7-like protein-domain-containing protein [Zalerion maritima]